MSMYNDFLNSVLPGNYALTKSMELTRVSSSGTLWYTKKYLVLYNFIFLTDDILTNEYVNKIINIFDTFIAGLDESVQDEAKRFFYPEDDCMNFKSTNFKVFTQFANKTEFSNRAEMNEYRARARKAYFARLMGTGGQSGIKKKIVQENKLPDFNYSSESMQKIIDDAVIKVCVERKSSNKSINSGDITRILSAKAISELERVATNQELTEEIVEEIIYKFPCSEEYPGKYSGATFRSPKYKAVEDDAFAPTRNERQILFYYGFVHSKSSGSNESEFSSLTPIGELALTANAMEFLSIWEHQKIKMISQPATADIEKIPAKVEHPEKFGISFTPYTDILGHLFRRGSLSLDEYKYIVSRKRHSFNEDDWVCDEHTFLEQLSVIKARVDGFGRSGDKKDYDCRKELLKYILGLRNDLPFDNMSIATGALKFENATVTVENSDVLGLLYSVYSKLDDYKIAKHKSVFIDSENDLRRRYIATVAGNSVNVDGKVKIYWDLYNIHPDNFIMLCSAISIAAISLGLTDIENMSKNNIDLVSNFLFEKFKCLFKSLEMRSLSAIKREVQKAIVALKNEDYKNYLDSGNKDDEQVLASYKEVSATDLFVRIEEISGNATVSAAENRERNKNLVILMKSYYMQRYSENNMLKCECCGEETFITRSDEPYVEFHHLIPFNIAYGPDHFLNLFALCPNCHRKIHLIKLESKREKYISLNSNNYLKLTFTQRLSRLKEERLLRSYHLEFLLADNAITLDEYNIVAA